MNKKSNFFFGLIFCLCLIPISGLYAWDETGGYNNQKLGLIFNIGSPLLTINEYNDNIQGGLGAKFWFTDKIALRGLIDFYYLNDSEVETSDLAFGIGVGFEYHFIRGKVSPYTGALVGVRISTGAANNLSFYFGGILGAEVVLLDYLSLFAEYNLLFTIDEPQFEIDLGIGNGSCVGLIIYLP